MSEETDNFKFTSINCWTDGTGFEYDGEPEDLIGFTPSSERFFSLTGKLAKNKYKQWNLWSNWIDKFQTDYRFLLLSDENAETVLQPNVDDPWMFTEYIFKGVGKQYNAETNTMENIDCLVVEPPLYDEESLKLKNPDRIVNSKGESDKFDAKVECAEYNRERIIANKKIYVKSCRTINENGWGEDYPVNDAGAKLYRVSVNVESVKWGEHGNIPPHTLNMYAPPSWLDTKVKKTIVPVTIAKIGYPVYAINDGSFYHQDGNDYIAEVEFTEEGEGNLAKFYYKTPSEGGKEQPKGKSAGNASKNEMNLKYIAQSQHGDLIHEEGCEFFVGKAGCAYCTVADANDMDITNKLNLDINLCYNGTNPSCPKFIKNSPKAISTYEAVAQSKDQYFAATYGMYASAEEKSSANMLTASNAMGGMLGGMGAALGAAAMSAGTRVFQPGLKDYTQQNVYFETSFKVEETPLEDFKITPKNIQGNGKGVKIERGSGNQNIDNIIPWKGGDNYAVGDADQINFARFTQSVMPCYNPDYCNEICGMAMQSGYKADSRAGSKNQNSPETNSVYVDYCRYYKDKNQGVQCPFDSIPKSAYEFQEAKKIGKKAISETINRWLSSYDQTIQTNNIVEEENTMFVKKIECLERENEDDIPEHYILYGKQDESTRFGGLNCSQTENVIIVVPTKKDNKIIYEEKTITAYKICKFTLTSINPAVARIDDLYFWWTPLDNNGNKITRNGESLIWFCKFEENIVDSTHFTYFIDNWNKFIGGSHPQYKDFSQRGGEFIQEKESQTSRDAMGDIGGDPEYSGIEQPKTKEGYWIDENGVWIMNELDVGESLLEDENGKPYPKAGVTVSKINHRDEIVTEVFQFTEKEKKEFSEKDKRESFNGITLSFRKSNSTVGEDGQTVSPETINCAVYLNDTKELIRALRFSPPEREDDKGNKVPMPPSVTFEDALPSERYGAHCPVCDYYLNEKYVTGNGSFCPWCGTKFEWKKLKKLQKTKSIGQVDYWGLPGTVIDSKSYFWKNPTLINNALLDQIKFKAINQGSAANYETEITNGYISDFKGYYKPVPSKEEVAKMPPEKRKKLWEQVKENDRNDIAMYNDCINDINTSRNGFDTSETDDRLIVPYSDSKGLKFFTYNHLQKLRKVIEPAMGYLIGNYTTNPDYNRMRPTYENRNAEIAPRSWVKAKSGVQPQILAANTAGNDCYIEYWSGDIEKGNVRDYYPPGCTWWLINNVVGLRYSGGLGSKVHLDDGAYGNETRSMACFFLHGFVPLNKEIESAYVILSPCGIYPAREPLGKDWNGRVHYQHYHAFHRRVFSNDFGMWHEQLGNHLHKRAGYKYWVYDEAGDMVPSSAPGEKNENAYKKTSDPNVWLPGEFKSENSFEGMAFGENGVPHYVKKHPKPREYVKITNKIGEFKDDGRRGEWMEREDRLLKKNQYQSYYDVNDEIMDEMMTDINYFFDEDWWGGDGQTPEWDYIKLQGQYENNSSWTRWGKDIVQIKTNNELWKQMKSNDFDQYVEENTGRLSFYCSDGEDEISYDFVEINKELIDDFFPEQMQEIPGYFNYKGMNSAGLQNANVKSKKPEIDEKWKNEQILYQEDSNNSGQTLKKDEYVEGGNVKRVLDITQIVKKSFDERIECHFTCEAGKTVEEVSKIITNATESSWTGTGVDWNPAERKRWNKRFVKNNSVLLSDCNHYPKLNSDKQIIETTEGEKMELSTICKSDVFQSIKEFPAPIDNNNDTIHYSINFDGEVENGTLHLDHNESVSHNEFCNLIQKELNTIKQFNCSISVLSNQRCVMTFENCYSINLSGNAMSYLGYSGTYYQTANRIISCSSSVEGYDPLTLIKGEKETSKPLDKPLGWKTEKFSNENQNFIVDLCQSPFETSRRDWRHRQGSIDCSNCICPNQDCLTNQYYAPKKVTVGEWSAKRNNQIGGTTTCPECGTDLTGEDGAVIKESDGIRSYFYDELFDYNPLIKEIHIASSDDNLFKCSFSVYCQNTETGVWVCLMKANYNPISKQFSYWTKTGASFSNGILKIEETLRARYIKVETQSLASRVNYHSINFTYSGNVITMKDNTDIEIDALIGETIKFKSGENTINNDIKIISNYIQDKKLIIKLDKILPDGLTECDFQADKYLSGISKFEVYGIPFKKSDLTVLPPPDYESGTISNEGIKLSQQPIQIMNVFAGSINGGMITLTEKEEGTLEEANDMIFETIEKTYMHKGKPIKYYEISSGTWFHEPKTNRIIVPTVARVGENIVSLESLTSNLDKEGVYLKDSIASQVVVEYWSASNAGVTLKASAGENGPAYQLEAESICKISNPEKLPDCGNSVKLFTSDDPNATSRKHIEWFCYNHIPSTIDERAQNQLGGYFKKPNFYGPELGVLTENVAKNFKNLFGENCNRLSPNCFTEVTFYGKPNSIISGNIDVYAPKEHKITYSFPGSGNQTIVEKTGGLKDGRFVVGIKPSEQNLTARKSFAWQMPTVVVYAKDRDPFKGN